MRKIIFALPFVLGSLCAQAQNPGDTIVVQAYDWSMPLLNNGGLPREMMVPFPDDPSLTFEKVLMQYNMRCRGANVNTTGGNYVACGEWDYSCNTYVHDSTRVDSTLSFIPSHLISDFTGTSFNYTNTPTFKSYRYIQQGVTVNSIVSETQSTVGTGTSTLDHVFAQNSTNGKSQYLYTASELTTAGVTAGDIDALLFDVLSASGDNDYLRVKLKQTTDIALTAANPHLDGFIEVYFDNTTLATGSQRLQFYTPFNWDGTSNVIVEFSYTNGDENTAVTIEGETTTFNSGLTASNEKYFDFNGENYIEADNYKGIDGSNARSSEAWIKTDVNNKEITSWGLNSASQKWNFRLNGDGTVRVEVNGGYIYGTTVIDDGEWHHIACTFSGTDVQQVKLYVDGNLETTGASLSEPVLTNTTNGINLRVSRGTNNRYFDGIIDDVRVWDTELTQAEIQDWMYRTLDSDHPQYAHLQVNYNLNEGTGDAIEDASTHGRDATVMEGEVWQSPHGTGLFKGWNQQTERPNLTFAQGDYTLTITNDTVYDIVNNPANLVREREVISQSGLLKDDSINIVNTSWYWEASNNTYYDENGVLINTEAVSADGTITVTDLDYFRRLPMRYELLSFVTPYGINLDLGQDGKTWMFDLTDFTPVLKGNKRLTMERGGQWNEEYDIKFLFIVGTPTRDVIDIQQIWRNDSRGYVQIMDDESFEERSVFMNPDAESYKIRSTITGHGQEGEFIPRDHFININGGATEYTYTVWKECADNPVFPQGGTWIYDRAGWCPGEVSDLHEFDITPHVNSGQAHLIDYGVTTASGTSNYIVNNQLVSYGAPNFTTDVAVVDVINPTDYVVYDRINPVCTTPKIVIRNTGSTALTSVDIEYWVNQTAAPQVYTWTGNLPFLEEVEVELPTPLALWDDLASVNQFHVEVKNPNGGQDEYAHNNTMTTSFKIPDVMPEHFYVQFRTNNAASESSYKIEDSAGNTIISRNGMSNATTYRDTVQLTYGCYTLTVLDTDDDGISFWANSDGNGHIRLREVGGTTLKAFEPDFGRSIIYQFTVTHPLTVEEATQSTDYQIFPNPTREAFFIKGDGVGEASIEIYDQLGKTYQITVGNGIDQVKCKTDQLATGIYFVKITKENKVTTKKLIIE